MPPNFHLIGPFLHLALLLKECVCVCGIWLLAAQKPKNKRPVWWKGKFALFQMLATCGEGGRHLFKGRPPTLTSGGGESFYRQSQGWGATCRNSTVISNSHPQLVISGLTSTILVVLGTVYLQFRGVLVPISLRSLLRIVAAQVLSAVWSSYS